MKSLTDFSQAVLEDFGNQCGVCTTRDQDEIARRVEHEGDQFLTITLASFGKDFRSSLEYGCIEPNSFQAFKHGPAGLPRFLGGFLALVFDENGVVRDDASTAAIRAVHGFTSMFNKKAELCSDERSRLAVQQFIATDEEVGVSARGLTLTDLNWFRRTFVRIFGDALQEVEYQLTHSGLLPKHGPGNTAEKLSANGKYLMGTWTDRLEFLFPAGENLFPNWGWYHQLQEIHFFKPDEEPPTRVTLVPKTASTPRIIAIEPAHMQYVQQGILEALTSALQGCKAWSLMGNLDQSPNRRLARESSMTKELATLDLSEASDRVSVLLVETALRDFPLLREAVMSSRSQRADVLGEVIDLNKFASMGSALCFPIETMVFTTLVIGTLWEHHTSPTLAPEEHWDLLRYQGRVRIYGDDIIVPVEHVMGVIDRLESFGLKVNRRKSFWKSNFRESCGMDAYAGVRITPVRMRIDFPTTPDSALEIVGTIDFRNQLYAEGGMDGAVKFLDRVIRRVLPQVRFIPVGHSSVGLWTYDSSKLRVRHCDNLHLGLVKTHRVDVTLPEDNLGEHGALMKYFLKRGDKPRDKDHLMRYGRSKAVRILPAWLPLIEGQGGYQTTNREAS